LAWYKLVIKSLFKKDGYTINWTKSNEMVSALMKFFDDNQVDTIHFDTIGLAFYERYIQNGIPKVLNHHNIESHMMLRRAKNESNLLKKLYFYIEGMKIRNYEKMICKLFDLNIVVSDLDKKRLLSIVDNLRVEIIPNGVDINYFRPMKNESKKQNLIFAASLDWYPNEDAVIYFIKDIWPFVKKRYPTVRFTIVGRNPSRRIKKLVKDDSFLRLTGFVEDVIPFFTEADVYVCPIRDGGGTKLKLLDAMAAGKAIVTTSIGAEGLEVKNEIHLLIADDPERFALQIIRILDNPKLGNQLGENARKLVEDKYSWENIGNKLNNIYCSLR
jgi:glycosyltransferase involved in cell wall biosynthesis